MKQKIQHIAEAIFEEVKAIREHLHQYPELSFEEEKTSLFVQQELQKIGIPFRSGIVKTGIVATIEGKNPSKKVIALRADLDALPIQEENNVPYKSCNAGIMHACGHDVHTASVLGAAKVLFALKDEWEGTIQLIFQPGEEKLPGGASLMIAEGVLKKPDVEIIIGQHVFPEMEVGNVGFRAGEYMASTDELYIKVNGVGGHAALPHTYNNPLMIASQLLMELDKRFQALKPTEKPSVLAFGKIEGKGATNVIPKEVLIEGTLRTMDETWRKKVHLLLPEIANEIADENSTTIEVEIRQGYPVLENNVAVTLFCKQKAEDFLGANHVHTLDKRMTAEDFAFFSQQVPACFYRLGVGNTAKNITSSVHTNTFDIDENALKTGVGLMAYLAISLLKEDV